MPEVRTDPLMEIIARNLFGIESVPKDYQARMVRRAAKKAYEYHHQVIAAKDARIKELEDIAYPAFNFFKSLVDHLNIAKSVHGKKQVECGLWEYRIRLHDNKLNEYIQAQHALQNAIDECQAEGGEG